MKDNELHYRGKVGTGFDGATMKEIFDAISGIEKLKKAPAVIGKLFDEKVTTWIKPVVVAEVSYSKLTTDKMFREPVFIRLRPDLNLRES